MAAFTVRLDLSGGTPGDELAGLSARLSDFSAELEEAGRMMMRSVAQNFAAQGRPEKWTPLSASTVRAKGHGRALEDTGALKGSIGFKAGPDRLTITASVPYAALQQEGGKAGRGGSATLPSRPFLVFQREDAAAVTGLLLGRILADNHRW